VQHQRIKDADIVAHIAELVEQKAALLQESA
jgi:hypothetical protein